MPTAPTQSRPPARTMLIASLAVLLLCLVSAGGFVWWYVKHIAPSRQIVFTPEDTAKIQQDTVQLSVRDTAGTQITANGPRGRGGRLLTANLRPAPPPDPDGVFTLGNFQVIRVGSTMARVQPANLADKQPAALVYRQRNWGTLADAPTFTIARRIVHEQSLAKQLAATPAQIDALTKIIDQPALKGVYLSALPVTDTDMAASLKVWTDYVAAQSSTDAAVKAQAELALLKTVGTIGSASLAKAKSDYATADNAIRQVLSTQQIDAYHEGRAVNP